MSLFALGRFIEEIIGKNLSSLFDFSYIIVAKDASKKVSQVPSNLFAD
jgi:hypothetical protein